MVKAKGNVFQTVSTLSRTLSSAFVSDETCNSSSELVLREVYFKPLCFVALVTTGYLSCFFSMMQYIMGSRSGTTMNINIACFGVRHASIVTATKNKSDTVLSLNNNQINSFITSFV